MGFMLLLFKFKTQGKMSSSEKELIQWTEIINCFLSMSQGKIALIKNYSKLEVM